MPDRIGLQEPRFGARRDGHRYYRENGATREPYRHLRSLSPSMTMFDHAKTYIAITIRSPGED